MTLSQGPAFTVRLSNFEGPFDLLLQLITRHRMDITEVALSTVTDEFIEHIKNSTAESGPGRWDLDQTSEFIVVAATLLDLKAARLLPQGEVEDPEDLALLEARDLLFARLLQYRAFKAVARWIEGTLVDEGRRFPRPGGLEEQFARLLPDVRIPVAPGDFAWLAAKAMAPRPTVEVSLAHLHGSTVSVQEQADLIVARLRSTPQVSFRALTSDAQDRLVVVARFLALLELYRSGAVAFEQISPLGELTLRWTGPDVGTFTISDEFDATERTSDDGTDA